MSDLHNGLSSEVESRLRDGPSLLGFLSDLSHVLSVDRGSVLGDHEESLHGLSVLNKKLGSACDNFSQLGSVDAVDSGPFLNLFEDVNFELLIVSAECLPHCGDATVKSGQRLFDPIFPTESKLDKGFFVPGSRGSQRLDLSVDGESHSVGEDSCNGSLSSFFSSGNGRSDGVEVSPRVLDHEIVFLLSGSLVGEVLAHLEFLGHLESSVQVSDFVLDDDSESMSLSVVALSQSVDV